MRQLFIVTETPFTERDYQRFGVEYLSQFFEVIICDCTAWLQKKFWQKYHYRVWQKGKYKIIKRYRDLLDISMSPGDVFIDCLGDYFILNIFRKKIVQKNIIFTKLQSGLYPIAPRVKTFRKRLNMLLFSPRKWLLHWRKITCLMNYVPPTVVVVGGETGLNSKDCQYAKFNLLAHSFDYDVFLQKQMLVEHINKDQYIVFLDQDLARHSDFDFDQVKHPVSEENYYHELDMFFTKIEKKLGIKVIFAAHPRADYSCRRHILNGRDFYQGITPQLIKNSSLVLLHDTTSISFAVLWYKPMVFLTTKELQKSILSSSIQNVAKIFNQEPLNISDSKLDEINIENWRYVDKILYDKYKNCYIKTANSPELFNWQLLVDFINKEFYC